MDKFNPIKSKGVKFNSLLKNGFFNLKFFHLFKRNLEKTQSLHEQNLYCSFGVGFFLILKLHQLNHDLISEYSENQIKRPRSEKVKKIQKSKNKNH